ncbi:hypothetical protein ANCCAN_19229 [Ancylostoma caninum]|uniref:Uncharacterized protein n=1 Tax=Ancylostoma caninum TaxID=29170 RepID=A0A368FVC3_ANCCA|nr:hypothetical protein ANCCAN_19229 [Ancylostoma caninum]
MSAKKSSIDRAHVTRPHCARVRCSDSHSPNYYIFELERWNGYVATCRSNRVWNSKCEDKLRYEQLQQRRLPQG